MLCDYEDFPFFVGPERPQQYILTEEKVSNGQDRLFKKWTFFSNDQIKSQFRGLFKINSKKADDFFFNLVTIEVMRRCGVLERAKRLMVPEF